MLNAIVRFSLRFRGIVIALGIAFLGYGTYTLTQANYDIFPEFAPPLVDIQTEAPGLSPEQVEVLVTTPIETAINGVPGVESIRSGSIQGISLITVTFQSSTDIYRARQLLSERLSSAMSWLPQGVSPPRMTPLTSSTSTVLGIGLSSQKLSLMELRTLADWTLRLRLRAVPGVAKVTVFGGEVQQYQIQMIPERLIQHNLSVAEVLAAARQATGVMGAGVIDTRNQRFVLQTQGQSLTLDQLAGTVVLHQNGMNLTLGQVANVVKGPEPSFGAGAVMGRPGVILMVEAQYGANILQVTNAVEKVVNDFRNQLQQEEVTLEPNLFRPATFVETALSNIRSSLIIGAILVMAVLFLFLFDFRTAAISCIAIPLSLLAAVTVMQKMGLALNVMTLGGLAIAIGEVVDDAVVDVENILRRLRENQHSANPRSMIQVVFDASIEVRSAVVYATFAVVLVFVPILTMTGVAGRIFAPLGIAYVLAILASLVVALTVTPALSLMLLGHHQLKEAEPPVIHWLKSRYRDILWAIERSPRAVITAVVLITGVGVGLIPFFSTNFLPELREGHFRLHMAALPGTSLQESLRLGDNVTQALLRTPYVRSVAQRVGRAELSEDVYGTHYSEFEVDLKPDLSAQASEAAGNEIRKALNTVPGASFSLKTFVSERIEETLSGYRAEISVNLFGSDLDSLDQKAKEITRLLSQLPGAMEVQMESPPGTPQIAIQLRPFDVARWGLDAVSVMDAVRTAFQGVTVGQVYQENRTIDVVAILPPANRSSIADIARLPLRNPDGQYVALGQLATIYETSGRYIVLHEGAQRVQTMTLNLSGVSPSTFVRQAQERIASAVKLPPGMSVQFGGTSAAQQASTRDLLVHATLAAFGIILLLSAIISNFRNLLLVLANTPFAMVGGVLAVFAMGGVLSLGPLVGFITLFGITLRNSIMLISHYEHLVAFEGMEWGLDAALRGASERLAPILMTATVTGLGLLPLAIRSGAPGAEIEGPMAIVILGGLVTSTVLNLLILPALALRYGRFQKPAAEL